MDTHTHAQVRQSSCSRMVQLQCLWSEDPENILTFFLTTILQTDHKKSKLFYHALSYSTSLSTVHPSTFKFNYHQRNT